MIRARRTVRREHFHTTQKEKEPQMALSQEEIRQGLAEIVNEVAGIPADDVQLDKSFTDDLDVDSLSMVEVVVAAEERFGVTIPDDDVKSLRTVGDAVAYIERAGVSA
jgi:acyl carrier protein